MMGVLSKKIIITGAVQGVGFRPFVYKIAQQFDLLGEVYNDSVGVIIIAQCTQTQHDKLLLSLNSAAPKLSRIVDISIVENYQDDKVYKDFSISKSRK
ncbi:MAG TPA: carbamoyltransferase HypF, partial [Gammaproteobacteria bacterium]|nr:carbamoyltransferase HypF [Gammaproteobacteria bacterium]